MHHRRLRVAALSVALALAGPVATSHAEETPTVTPYRPGIGSPAVLSAPGYFEVEAGLEHRDQQAGDEQEFGVLLKYGLSERWGLMFGISPWLRAPTDGDAHSTGSSDLMLGLKTVSRVNDDLAIGGQWFASLPTGARAFRGDGVDLGATLLVGIDTGAWHTDINLGLTRLAGDPGPGLGKVQWQWSAAVSYPLKDNLSAGFELSGTHQSGAGDPGLTILALSHQVNRRLVLDAYVGRDWNVDDPGWRIGAGLTYLFTR
jgi:hypothetical protein